MVVLQQYYQVCVSVWTQKILTSTKEKLVQVQAQGRTHIRGKMWVWENKFITKEVKVNEVHHFSACIDRMDSTEALKDYIIIKSLLNLSLLTLNQSSCDYSTSMQLNVVEKFQRISSLVRLKMTEIGCATADVLFFSGCDRVNASVSIAIS